MSAWIETLIFLLWHLLENVALSWVRGLKQFLANFPFLECPVALSWVRGLKLQFKSSWLKFFLVALSWVRGLKRHNHLPIFFPERVALSWVRGLKHDYQVVITDTLCRTLMSAWIETFGIFGSPKSSRRRTLMSAWIETLRMRGHSVRWQVALSWVRGLKLCLHSSTPQPR